MIDLISISTKGGCVLWQKQLSPIQGKPIDNLVQQVLLEERSGQNSFKYESYALKWLFSNEFDLIFIAVYLNMTQLLYIEELLEAVRANFLSLYKDDVRLSQLKPSYDFDSRFDEILRQVEEKNLTKAAKVQRVFTETKKFTLIQKTPSKEEKAAAAAAEKDKKAKEEAEMAAAAKKAADDNKRADEARKQAAAAENDEFAASAAALAEQQRVAKLKRAGGGASSMRNMRAGPGVGGKGKGGKPATPAAPVDKSKKSRKWDGAAASKEEEEELDVAAKLEKLKLEKDGGSKDKPDEKKTDGAGAGEEEVGSAAPQPSANGKYDYNSEQEEESEPEEEDEPEGETKEKAPSGSASAASKPAAESKPSWFKKFTGFVSGLAGQKVLDKDDLKPVLEQMRMHLMSKNVAQEVSEKLCESVGISLEGKKMESLNTVTSTVKKALEATLTRILTPSKPIDVLQGILAAQEQKRPYSIVFVGVNGVGKSTSLAKTAYYFLSKGFKVSIVACDTFRAGAVEQLKTHARALNVPLFERGYNKDAAAVAMEGIANAKKGGHDVVLIDTAGRMQHNDPLMKALAKLIHLNQPDLVLFVGEALVGNDGVDQLVQFNRSLGDLSEDSNPRLVDGIVLTKFDTIDDKVGAAISMTYSTGQPIMFVGVGQTYKDLRRMNVKMLIKALLK